MTIVATGAACTPFQASRPANGPGKTPAPPRSWHRDPRDYGGENLLAQSCRHVALAVKQLLSSNQGVSQIAKIAGVAGVGVFDDLGLSIVLGA